MVVADGPGTGIALALDATHVYWTAFSGHVLSVAKNGSDVTVLASEQEFPLDIAVDDEAVYWTERDRGTVTRSSKQGLDATPLWSSDASTWPYDVAVDSEFAYFSTSQEGIVRRLPKHGGEASIVFSGFQTSALVIDDNSIFVVQYADTNSVVRVSKAGNEPMPILFGAQACGISLHGDAAFVTGTNDPVSLYRVPKAGGAATILADEPPYAESVAVDDHFAYWTAGSSVYKTPIDGGPTTLFATESDEPNLGGIATDETCVYWLAGSRLMKVAK